MDTKNKGAEPLNDEQLDKVSGGVSADDLLWKQAELMARADGRTVPLADGRLASTFCACHHRYKWAHSDRAITSDNRVNKGYTNIKCYKCGKTHGGSIY